MKTIAAIILFLCPLCSIMAAPDATLESTLTNKYERSILILRHPVDSNSQRYSASGELLSGGKEGPWTIDAAIEINEIHLTPDKVIIDAKRRIYGFDYRQNRLLPVNVKEKDKPKLLLEISLDSPLSSVEQAEIIFHRIFASNEGELADSVPVYWRSFLAKQYGATKADDSQTVTKNSDAFNSPDESTVLKLDPKSMTPPRAVYTPEPDYTELARHLRFQGNMALSGVVDTAGKMTRVRIVQPVGFGLDEKTFDVVQSWKFRPAMRDGKPVAVELQFWVIFRLY